MVADPLFTPVTVADVPLPETVRLAGCRLLQVMVRLAGVIVARTVLLLPTQTNGGAWVIVTFTVSPLQLPLLHLSLTVHLSLSSQLVLFFAGSGTQQSFSHFRQSSQRWVVPELAALPPQCQPALTMPTPGLATISAPSA